MDRKQVAQLLEKVKNGDCGIDEAALALQGVSSENMGFACLDHHRCLRTGIPEVVFGENKTAEQICRIFAGMLARPGTVMATRVSSAKAGEVCRSFPKAVYHDEARILVARGSDAREIEDHPLIVVVSAGTSDVPVAEEAKITAECLGNRVEAVHDVGVAGIHRLYSRLEMLSRAAVLIVVAGMEGALPSVVAGLVDTPVIAVPTSIGYGTGFGGIAALLGMLNSCAPGMAVVNIDNGFGAACMASLIVRGQMKEGTKG
ncbi:MAG: nickel pincer cofactor biosynthesis protein LarB [Proteobacteria bacterium]|nr:nickel pincer cofactor biosynthesis protein LarB [Pseudomonadota bacterium]MBU4297088.1 nickel pincer cofactor biosynthesis protein LarB [Pseudomonadota bacterium]MCG2747416.1 nickel pincer cofactor biosynthesis protein LarB [Desulfobulbaceae bacterium]